MRSAVFLMAVWLCAPTYASSRHETSSSSTKHSTGKSGHSRKSRKQAHRSRPQYQAAPTPHRLQEIQQALADKGYYKGPVNGAWGQDSTDALRRFQTDQKIEADGKINSKSLILMGLGSKHTSEAAVTPSQSNSIETTPAGSTPNDHRSPEGSQGP